MASGSSGRANAGSKGFDFASDDILCSYEDFGNQESSNGNLSEPAVSANSGKDFHNRRGRSPTYPTAAYSQPEDTYNQDVISVVEKSMKRNTENLMRFLEGISSRLSQLELYCYNLDKSIGEMRSDLVRDHGESDSKLKAIEKHLQEVHRSVQILRDKQELADTQKELAKLQLGQKDSISSSHSQSTEGRASPAPPESKKIHNPPDPNNNQLALALPHQVAPAPPPPQPQPQQSVPSQNVPSQQQAYYQLPTQYATPESQYRNPQMQDPRIPQQAPPQPQATQQYPQYQQIPPQISYPGYAPQPPPPSQTNTPPPQESLPNHSMPMQVPYGYAGPGRATQQQIKSGYGSQPGDGYGAPGLRPVLPPGSSYMMYEAEPNRAHYQPQLQQHFSQVGPGGGGYAPASGGGGPVQNPPPNPANLMTRNQTFGRNHPYGELIEKLASMGFRTDHTVGVIQRMEENGQPVDFNSVLDRLNVHAASGGPQRGGWSG